MLLLAEHNTIITLVFFWALWAFRRRHMLLLLGAGTITGPATLPSGIRL